MISRPDEGRRGCGVSVGGGAVVSCFEFRGDGGIEIGGKEVLVEEGFNNRGIKVAAEFKVAF